MNIRPLLMLSQNVVLFCQKRTTDQKTNSYAVLKGHFWITEKRTTVVDSPILSFLDRVGLSKSVVIFYSRAQIPPPQMLEPQAQASPMLMRLPSLLLLAGSRRGTCLTPPTSSSLGSFSMAASSMDVLLPATALAVALVAFHEIQRHDLSLKVKPVDELHARNSQGLIEKRETLRRALGHSCWRIKTLTTARASQQSSFEWTSVSPTLSSCGSWS